MKKKELPLISGLHRQHRPAIIPHHWEVCLVENSSLDSSEVIEGSISVPWGNAAV